MYREGVPVLRAGRTAVQVAPPLVLTACRGQSPAPSTGPHPPPGSASGVLRGDRGPEGGSAQSTTPRPQSPAQLSGSPNTTKRACAPLREILRGGPAHWPPSQPASMFGIWGTFSSVVFYLTLAVGIGGLLGNALVLWHLGFHIKKGPFAIYVLHLAAADFLFLGCQLAFSAVQVALGSEHSLHFPVTFVAFSVGLWLLAAFSAERCLSDLFPTCYQGCRPRHTSGVVCGLSWALAPPAMLLTADACGLLRKSTRPLACLRYHVASVAGLLALACVAFAAGLVLLIWGACCSPRQHPRFFGAVLGSGLLLLVCGLPYLLCWTLRPYLPSFVLSTFFPLATLLACVHCSARPLIYFMVGRQPGRREPLRAVLWRSLGEGTQLGAGRVSLPMGCV
ncbi:mas-related G-protein coupled receptor member G [Oryx dammah]|uniref:mas-related G-protein coupled receptor member G n=1 Tax=Oryx dammah TaxID=59534 RepID=UPI001A9A8604|nr:mas-related G-protein coupled receptor member G [Oryx dammah]